MHIQRFVGIFLLICLASVMIPRPTFSSDMENPLFGYTHLLPSPFTLPSGRLVYGTDIAYGLTDFFQVGTNLVRDLYKVLNANGKVSLVDYPDFSFGVFTSYERYNYQDFAIGNPNITISSWLPGAVAAYALANRFAIFAGGNLNFSSVKLISQGIENSGFVRGVTLQSDISWAYNPVKKGRVGNVLSAGVSYDLSYRLYGFGVSHHWPGFHLGIHYYPNASISPVQPIIAGGGSISL